MHLDPCIAHVIKRDDARPPPSHASAARSDRLDVERARARAPRAVRTARTTCDAHREARLFPEKPNICTNDHARLQLTTLQPISRREATM